MYGSIFSLTTKDLVCIKETEVKKGLLLQLVTAIRGLLKKERSVKEREKMEDDNNEVLDESKSKGDDACDSDKIEEIK